MKTRVCARCKAERPDTAKFFNVKRGRTASYCHACHATKSRERRLRHRLEALTHYGSVCACCDEVRPEFLSFDHIDGGGAAHRRAGGGVINIATWLKNQGYPSGFRVLCHNCNLSLGLYGYCPHQVDGRRFSETPTVQYAASPLYCKYGHSMFGDALWLVGKTKKRMCRICVRNRKATHRERNALRDRQS